jgi:hypothetical protein
MTVQSKAYFYWYRDLVESDSDRITCLTIGGLVSLIVIPDRLYDLLGPSSYEGPKKHD